jgi:hypothetical protein
LAKSVTDAIRCAHHPYAARYGLGHC